MSIRKGVGVVVAGLLVLIVAAVVWVFAWSGRNSYLQQAAIERRDYAQSVAAIQEIIDADTANDKVRTECRPIIKNHHKKTDKAIMLLHGVSGCSSDMSGLAEHFYQAGYNVYVPRLPEHGLVDDKQYAQVRASQLVQFMSQQASAFSGLGGELGIAGHSGGGTLATWLAQYGDGLISRVLLLAPFYEPDPRLAPKWQLAPLRNIYGNHLLPDRYGEGLSYWALANFVTIKQNYRADNQAKGLKHLAIIYSQQDGMIDQQLAERISQTMAQSSGASYKHFVLPEALGIKHSLVEPSVPEVQRNKEQLYSAYQKAYENK